MTIYGTLTAFAKWTARRESRENYGQICKLFIFPMANWHCCASVNGSGKWNCLKVFPQMHRN